MKTGIDKVTIYVPNYARDHILGFADVLIDGHLILKNFQIVEKTSNQIVVKVASRPILRRCDSCGIHIPNLSKFCSECGIRLPPPESNFSRNGKLRISSSIFYSMDDAWFEKVQDMIVCCYKATKLKGLGQSTYSVSEIDGLFDIKNDPYPVGVVEKAK